MRKLALALLLLGSSIANAQTPVKLGASNITAALGYTPVNPANLGPSLIAALGYTPVNPANLGSQLITALGYTPVNSANLRTSVISALGYTPLSAANLASQVTAAYGYTPADANAVAQKCSVSVESCSITLRGVGVSLASWIGGNAQLSPYISTIDSTLTGVLNWTVCSGGCTFTSPLDAWNVARSINLVANSGSIVIKVADGTYNISDQFYTAEASSQYIQFIGNVSNPQNVVFNFTNIKGNNFSGFIIQAGGRLGRSGLPGIDGLTLRGTGARLGTSSWASQSYGAGVHTVGSGSNAFIGMHVVIDSFYYSILADNNSSVTGDGATYVNAGDVAVLARFGSVVQCDNCISDTASDIGTDEYGGTSILGYNYLAEAGGTIIANGAVGRHAQVACFASLNTGRMWAHNALAQNCTGIGFRATENGVVEGVGAKSLSNTTGVYADTGGMVSLDRAEIATSVYDGVQAGFGGIITGNAVNSHDNGTSGLGIGIRVLAGGNGSFTNTRALLVRNAGTDINVDIGTACNSPTAPCNPPSRLIIN